MSVTHKGNEARSIGTVVSSTQLRRYRGAVAVVVAVALLAAAALWITGGSAVGDSTHDEARAIAAQTARLNGLAAHHGATVVNPADVARAEAMAVYYLDMAAAVEAPIAETTGTSVDAIVYGEQTEAIRFAEMKEALPVATVEYEPEAIRFDRIADRHRAQIR